MCPLFTFKYESRINFKASINVLIKSVTYILLFLLALQLGLSFLNQASGYLEQSGRKMNDVLREEILLPYTLYAVLIGCMVLVNRFFSNKNKPTYNAYAQLFLISLICFCVSMANARYVFGAAGALMAIPLMASLLFIDHKPLYFSLVLNAVLSVIFCVLNVKEYYNLVTWRYPGLIFIVFALFFILYCIARSTLINAIKLVEESVFKDQRLARDSFTGLLNHASFYNHLDQLIMENHRQGTVFSLIIWDIDNFKSINDKFGHEIGDRVLTWFIQALKDLTDEDHDLCFRYGGEEFAVLLRRDITSAYQLSCDVREKFTNYSAAMPMLGHRLTASAGICEYNRQFGGSREFFSAADRALYTAKKAPGKNTSTIWTDGMFEQSIVRQYLKRSMFMSEELEEDPTQNEQP